MNNAKTKYEEPKMEIVVFGTADIITTSGGFEGDPDPLYENGEANEFILG